MALDQLLPAVRAALEAARSGDGRDPARAARVVAAEFGFLGRFTEARVVDAGPDRAAAALLRIPAYGRFRRRGSGLIRMLLY